MGYRKTTESKLIRIIHEVDFRESGSSVAPSTAGDIRHMLSSVPAEAKLSEVYCRDGGVVQMLFIEEKEDKTNGN